MFHQGGYVNNKVLWLLILLCVLALGIAVGVVIGGTFLTNKDWSEPAQNNRPCMNVHPDIRGMDTHSWPAELFIFPAIENGIYYPESNREKRHESEL
jgi:uncharacterized protein YneF (UPF0154 family)